ncbi:flagellar hook-basal body complex protein [Pseudorhodobacter sp.]|uniref:flagellar hook-basal body complex protein n=1 Tax=Pseudorhodobacter sp. TaxID=1934400 RepID=UPI0039E5B372
MDAGIYTTLTRQSGLMREMQVVAHNIANISTTGFRREGVIFSEYVKRMEDAPSLSMANADTRHMDLRQAGLSQTGGMFDFAIQGDGFFLIETPEGQSLTRAGHFMPNAEGELVNPDGHRLLDLGGTPIFVPPDMNNIALSQDGTLSGNGQPLAQIGLWQPGDPLKMTHMGGTIFISETVVPADSATILQGFVEDSNVNPISEIARMIEVQRAYEMGQGFLEKEDERMRGVIQTLGR